TTRDPAAHSCGQGLWTTVRHNPETLADQRRLHAHPVENNSTEEVSRPPSGTTSGVSPTPHRRAGRDAHPAGVWHSRSKSANPSGSTRTVQHSPPGTHHQDRGRTGAAGPPSTAQKEEA